MTKFILSRQRYHIYQMSITQPVRGCRAMNEGGRKTIMFLASKLCLLIALLLGWLLMDITFHAVPRAAERTRAFWNERLRDAALKLVQQGTIHHVQHCQQGAAASPCHTGVTGRLGVCCACSEIPLRFLCIWNSWATVAAGLGAI